MRKGNRRLAAQRRRREELLPQVTQLALEGYSRQEIAQRVGVSRTTIRRWLQELRQEHAARAVVDTAQMIAETIKRYNSIYREAMKAWRRSQAERQVRMAEESGGDGSGGRTRKKKSIRSEVRAGDPAFLAKAMEALKAIRQIKGLDAPRRTEIAGPGGGPIDLATLEDQDLRNLTNEQLAELEREVEARILGEETSPAGTDGVHDLHQARLPPQLAPPGIGKDAEPGGKGDLPAADGLHAAPARQE